MMPMTERFYSVNGQMMGYESGGVKKDFLTDHLGSITAEIDQTQTRTYDTRYSAYGRNNWSIGTGCGFGWVGSYGYRETGLFHMSHYVRARHYLYVTGGWSTVDPLWPEENPFGYVGGRPTYGFDYDGRRGSPCGGGENECGKLPGPKGACIALLCSMDAATSMKDLAKNIFGEAFDEILKDWIKGGGSLETSPNLGPSDCCKQAAGKGLGGTWPSLNAFLIGKICSRIGTATSCVSMMKTARGCSKCCDIKYKEGSQFNNYCKFFCEEKWGV